MQVFEGHIAGLGTTSGVRVVVGVWAVSPYGPFADAMVETAAGHRVLVAPEAVAGFVASTYRFDEVRREPVAARPGSPWRVESASLDLWFTAGARAPITALLRAVPDGVRDAEWFARACDPVARRLLPGVRTHGSAGSGRTEWYAARSVRRVVALGGRFDGVDLGSLAPVTPPVRFGFGSAPARPSLTRLRSHVRGADVPWGP